MRDPYRRGSALLVTLIALAVLMVIVAGAIKFTGTNREAAASKLRGDSVAACAETARKYLLGRLRTFNIDVVNLQLNERLPDAPATADRSTMLSAHYGQTAPTATIVMVDSNSFSSSLSQVQGIGSRSFARGGLGGQYYRVVVKCRESPSRESELEFVFRHGI